MILVKIEYKIYNSKIFAIIEKFKTWHDYLKNCKHKVFILINYNNFYYFINIKY